MFKMTCEDNPTLTMSTHKSVWFWLYILSFLLLIAFAIAYETTGKINAQGIKVYPWWVWGLLITSLIFLFFAFVFMIVGLVREKRRVREACMLTHPGDTAAQRNNSPVGSVTRYQAAQRQPTGVTNTQYSTKF